MDDFRLTIIENCIPVADSRQMAALLGIQHESFMRTICRYQEKIESQSEEIIRFEVGTSQPNKNGASHQVKYCLLTEDQFFVLATLSRNTPQVVAFKCALVKAFLHARKALAELSHAPNPSRSIPANPSSSMDSMVSEFVLTAIDSLSSSLSSSNAVDDLERVTTILHGFVNGYKELKQKESHLKKFMASCSSDSLHKASLKDAISKVVNQRLTPHLALCAKKSKSRVANRNRFAISFSDLNRDLLANGIKVAEFSELLEVMTSLGFDYDKSEAPALWVYIH